MENIIIGREREIKILDKLLTSEKPEFLALYGRRRVGKTFLIREYFKPQTVFSFTGSFETETKVQLDNFFREYISRTKGNKETSSPKHWSTAFSFLADYLYSLQYRKKKIVVFIDELPWLDRPKSGFVAALEYFWNQDASKMNNVLLIVCGSAASWMQKKLLKAKGGLYNRITARIKLMPFNLYETELFCKKKNLRLSKYQIIQLYMAMGGIPFYLNELSPGKSAAQLIDEICLNSSGLLSNEYEQLYYSLFKNADNHMSIIEALANKPNGMTRTELVEKISLTDGGTFVRALNDLIESGFISKYLPFDKKKKDSIYRLIDLYSLFYLKFIKSHVSESPHRWQKISGQSSFKAWSGYAYENICMLHVNQILEKLGLSGTYTEISSWKHRGDDEIPGTQIDLLIDRKDGVVNLCEAKFTEDEYIITKNYNAELRRKRSIFNHVTKTKKTVVTTLITTYPAIRNKYYFEEIHTEVTMEDLFTKS
ncbi:MAG: ATP-binding protein [Bacteroidota bacterium]|nr:ATP-binding protein [Bacteroidota bacterium]